MRSEYQILQQVPSADDYIRLRQEGGLSAFSEEAARKGLKGTLFSAVVFHNEKAIGMGRIIGDGGCFFQIVDIVVSPAHQGKGLGKAIMTELMAYATTHLPKTAYLSLLADVPANKLYEQFGFRETAPTSLGMSFRVE